MIDFDNIFCNLQKNSPTIHCITNHVTANDCANLLLACGASPIMADDIHEVTEITSFSDALLLNIGMLNKSRLLSMLSSGKQANAKNIPIIFDPVGVGSSSFRAKSAAELLEKIHFSVIKGNISEIKALSCKTCTEKGVDADISDWINSDNLEDNIRLLMDFSKKYNTISVASGKYDIVCNSHKCCVIKNGHEMMSKITGTGCMLSCFISAFAAANQKNLFDAVISAVCAFGICGELAFSENIGCATYKTKFFDEIYFINSQKVREFSHYEIFQK